MMSLLDSFFAIIGAIVFFVLVMLMGSFGMGVFFSVLIGAIGSISLYLAYLFLTQKKK